MGELPPELVMPRISNSVWPGPFSFIEIPGVSAARAEKLTMPRAARSAPVTAVILMGVSCTVDVRFSAVTTISSRPTASAGAPAPLSASAALTSVGATQGAISPIPIPARCLLRIDWLFPKLMSLRRLILELPHSHLPGPLVLRGTPHRTSLAGRGITHCRRRRRSAGKVSAPALERAWQTRAPAGRPAHFLGSEFDASLRRYGAYSTGSLMIWRWSSP